MSYIPAPKSADSSQNGERHLTDAELKELLWLAQAAQNCLVRNIEALKDKLPLSQTLALVQTAIYERERANRAEQALATAVADDRESIIDNLQKYVAAGEGVKHKSAEREKRAKWQTSLVQWLIASIRSRELT